MLWPLQMFDPNAEYSIVERRLPHWSQAGTMCFITFRLFDSMPTPVLKSWHAERDEWLRRHGVDPNASWQTALASLEQSPRGEFTRTFSRRWHEHLDRNHGTCPLRDPALAQVVATSLRHFDGDRYDLTDFIVMPNHVHILAAFVDEEGMLKQCDSWKHFTATQINKRLGRSGRLWQQDGFDHLVRSVEHFEAFRRYIAANPTKARLKAGDYLHYSKPM